MKIESNKLYNGDCLEIMQFIPDKHIDHIICDLPFYQVVKDEWDNQWSSEQEYIEWCRMIIIEYKRILKDNGNIFLFTSRQHNRKIATILDEYFNEKRIIIWSRKRNFNSTRGKALAIERIIHIGTNEGDLILDNCSGSGTLAIECIKNNRNWIMIEKEVKYYDISMTRISEYYKLIESE